MTLELKDEIRSMMYGVDDSDDGVSENEHQEQPDLELDEGESNEREEGEQRDTRRERSDTTAREGEGQEGEIAETEETLEQRYSNLLAEYNKLSGEVIELQQRGYKPVTDVAAQRAQQERVEQTPAVSLFELDENEIQRALIEDDAKPLIGILRKLHEALSFDSQLPKIREQVLLDVPALASEVAAQRVTMLMAVQDFYKRNPDLVQYMPTCGRVTNLVAAEKPDASLNDVLDEVEKRVRKQLGLKRLVLEENADKGRPAFHQPKGARKSGAPKISGLKSDIAEMQKARDNY